MEKNIPDVLKAWIDEVPYRDWDEVNKTRAMTAFENILRMDTDKAITFAQDMVGLFKICQEEDNSEKED